MHVSIKPGSLLDRSHPELSKIDRFMGIWIDEDDFNKFMAEAKSTVSHLSPDEQYVWAVYNAHKHPGHRKGPHPPPPVISPGLPWGIILELTIIILLLLLLMGVKLHSEPITYNIAGDDYLNHLFNRPIFPQIVTSQGIVNNILKIGGVLPTFTGSSLNINCTGGCGGAASFLDNATFTAGTTPINITGGWFSSAPTACTDGKACSPSLTSDRKLFVQSFQGTSPWVVSLTSTTITGTVAVTQSTSPWVASCTAANCLINVSQWAGSNLGAMANYGTSPGAVLSPGVNAFITNTPAVTLTSTTITGTVAVTESGTWSNRIVGNAGGVLDTTQNAAVAANSLLQGCNFTTAPATVTTGNQGAVQCNSKGEILTQLTDGTTNVAVIAGTTALKSDMSSVAGTATVTAAAGVQKVGIVGNANAAIDAANNAAAPANVIVDGYETATQGTTQPTAATAGNVRRAVESTDGAIYTRLGGPVTWACGLPTVTTLAQCQAAPGAGLKLYVSEVVAQANGATGSIWILETGTGANCGTGTAAVLPVGGTAGTGVYGGPTNTTTIQPASVIQLNPPVAVTVNQAVCALASVSTSISIMGYSAP